MDRLDAAPGGVRVRKMRAADVDTVVAIEAGTFGTPWQRETFADLVDRPSVELLVMEDPGEGVVGYAVLWCILDQAELANLAVVQRLRGRGLGRLLLDRVVEVARSRGAQTMFLEVRASNDQAIALYRSFGFADVGLRLGYYQGPREDALIMRAEL